MEPRGSIADAASNALVSTVGFYTKALEQERREAEGYFMAMRSAHRLANKLRAEGTQLQSELAQTTEQLAAQVGFGERAKSSENAVNQAAGIYRALVDPVLKAVAELCQGIDADADRRSVLSPELAQLHRVWLASNTLRELVAQATPAHPAAVRAAADGSPERDA